MSAKNCTLGKRCLAISYDCLLLFSVYFVSTLFIIPFMDGEAINNGNILYQFYLLLITLLYFCWHWVHGGQTLGMRSWKIKAVNEDMSNLSWYHACLRFFYAILSWLCVGCGFIWILFDKNKLSLHDHLSKTRLIIQE